MTRYIQHVIIVFLALSLYPACAVAQATGHIVSVSPSQVEIGQPVTVSFSAPTAGFNQYDAIVITDPTGVNFIESKYVGQNPTGSVVFTMRNAGTYVANYRQVFGGGSYSATSNTFTVIEPPAGSFTLSATPLNAVIGETITVAYSAPAHAFSQYDSITLYTVGSNYYVETQYIGSNPSGTKSFTIKNSGTYVFKYQASYGNRPIVAESNPVTVSLPPAGSFTLSASPTSVEIGQPVSIAFSAPQNLYSQYDSIIVYTADTNMYVETQYVGVSPSGTKTFTIKNPGTYVAKYQASFGNRPIVAESQTFDVRLPSPNSYTLSISPGAVDMGQPFSVSYSAPSHAFSQYDSITIFDNNTGYYVDAQSVGVSPSGTKTFTVRSPGVYVAKYQASYGNRPYVVTSNPVTVRVPSGFSVTPDKTALSIGETITTAFTAPTGAFSSSDQIILINAGTGYYVASQFVGPSLSGNKTFRIDQPGTYVFQYQASFGNFPIVATSSVVTVTLPPPGSYTLSASPSTVVMGEAITVSYSAPPAFKPYDTIIVSDAATGVFVSSFVVGGTGTSGTRSVTIKNPGTYVFKYQASFGNFPIVATSNPVTVTIPPPSAFTLTVSPTTLEAGELFTVSYSAPTSAHSFFDVIAVYEQGTNRFVDSSLVGLNSSGTKTFSVRTPGTYVAKYIMSVTGTPVAKVSAPFSVVLINLSRIENYPLPGQGSIIALGDSITFGRDATFGNDYVSLLSARLGETIMNKGVSGDTTAEALARLQTDVLSQNPRLVLILLGGNDFLENVPTATTFNNLRTIINQIHAQGGAVFLIGIRDWFFTNYDAQFRGVAVETGAAYAPDVLSGIIGNFVYTTDGVHPRNNGHLLMTDRLEPYVRLLRGN